MSSRWLVPIATFAFGTGFFLGFVVAIYAAVTLFGTVALAP